MGKDALYGEFDWIGVHIDINKNKPVRSVEASTLHELGHQELASSTILGMLDFLITNIFKIEKDEKTKRKLEQFTIELINQQLTCRSRLQCFLS